MKIGITFTCYNRPDYLSQTMESLLKTDFPQEHEFLFAMHDDASTDPLTKQLFDSFDFNNIDVLKYRSKKNRGVHGSLDLLLDILYKRGCDVFVNIDADTLVNRNWMSRLIQTHLKHPDTVTTGFNTPSHHVLQDEGTHYLKETVGGVNMIFSRTLYETIVKQCFYDKAWDWHICHTLKKPFVVLKPSCIQHIGLAVGMNCHGSSDTALDFIID